MSAISSSKENILPYPEPLKGTEIEESKEPAAYSSGIKRPVSPLKEAKFKVPSPVLKKAKKEGAASSANPERSPPLSLRTGKPLSPETLKYIEEMKRKMSARMAERQQPEVDKINAVWQKGQQEIESKK